MKGSVAPVATLLLIAAASRRSSRLRGALRMGAASLFVLVGALETEGAAQSTGPIRLAVGAPAGGSIDVYSRIVAEPMSARLGRPVIIEIKAGANGNIAAQWVVDGPADGSLVWVGAQSMIEINPSTYKNLRWKRSDFIPVIKGIETPLVLVTHPSVPATTFEQWVDWAKANRGKPMPITAPARSRTFSATSSTSVSASASPRCLTAAMPRR